MDLSGCQGHDPTPTLEERTCPVCGATVEVFSTDVTVTCDNCGFEVHNDIADCISRCKYSRLCIGEDLYARYKEAGII